MDVTCDETLLAVSRACSPDSVYIIQEVERSFGVSGGNQIRKLIRRRLQTLADEGLLIRSQFTNGYYGYRWDITDAGRKFLEDKP